MFRRLTVAAAFLILFCTQVSAQVVRCTDHKTGKTTYSDQPCRSHQTGVEVLPAKTQAEIQQERLQAREAIERKRDETRRAREEAYQRPSAAETEAPAAASPNQVDKADSADCKKALRDLDVAHSSITSQRGVPAAQAAVTAACGIALATSGRRSSSSSTPALLPAPPQPSVITSCDAGGCWDNLGGRYNRVGDMHMGPAGVPCRMVGRMMHCP